MQTSVYLGARAVFWRRFAGAFVDGIFLGIVSSILRAILGIGSGNGIALVGGSGVGLVISAVYFTAFIGAERGQSLGQMALGIRVIGLDSGGSIGHRRAFLRWLVSLVSAIVLLLGYLWMLWDREKQCWHDKAANDVVVMPVRD